MKDSKKRAAISFTIILICIGTYITMEFIYRLQTNQEIEGILGYQLLKLFLILYFIGYAILFKQKKGKIEIIITLWAIYIFLTNVLIITDYKGLTYIMYIAFLWPLSILYFSYNLKNNPHVLSIVVTLFCSLLFVFSFLFIREYNFVNQLLVNKKYTLNISYFILLLVPWSFMINKKIIRYLMFIVIIILIVLSMKRTAIIGLSLSLISAYIAEIFQKKSKEKLQYIFYLLIIIVFGALLLLSINESTNGYLFSRFERAEDYQGEKRYQIYTTIFELLSRSNMSELLFGHGHNTVKDYMFSGFSAHNDWLESVFDYGFMGLIFYILLHYALIKEIYKLYQKRSPYTAALVSSYMIFLTMSLTSHLIIYPFMFIIMTILWGVIIGITKNQSITYIAK